MLLVANKDITVEVISRFFFTNHFAEIVCFHVKVILNICLKNLALRCLKFPNFSMEMVVPHFWYCFKRYSSTSSMHFEKGMTYNYIFSGNQIKSFSLVFFRVVIFISHRSGKTEILYAIWNKWISLWTKNCQHLNIPSRSVTFSMG